MTQQELFQALVGFGGIVITTLSGVVAVLFYQSQKHNKEKFDVLEKSKERLEGITDQQNTQLRDLHGKVQRMDGYEQGIFDGAKVAGQEAGKEAAKLIADEIVDKVAGKLHERTGA